ncbi:hypothetical protein [Pseudomethylobacillus aquaticus]|uniref:hypothetical protein n=1 Tax=Pseudomethylobacillus aquaticus TaxID=2676064 RepID=UPI0012D7FA32|nr:hypothetical protein [Pseudomethylobacillus aquaticus]
MATPDNQYHEKLFSDEVRDVDPNFDTERIPVYEFTGRIFREEQNKPYEPSR